MPQRACLFGVALLLGLLACAPRIQQDPKLWAYDRTRLPLPDLALTIPGLGPATDAPDRTLRLCAAQPVVVLVHGCKGSAGRFRALAEVFAFHGQQAVAFSYNDRDRLILSASRLSQCLRSLSIALVGQPITVIGHSQGGLIARRALCGAQAPIRAKFCLVTLSAPFGGIHAANHCGSTTLKVLSMGLVVPVCQVATGSKWREITRTSDFIRHPPPLSAAVESHLLIRTDERGSCREQDASGRCLSSDETFSLEEQCQPNLEQDPRIRVLVVRAGHVEIAGDQRMAPRKLIRILQEEGLMRPTEATRIPALEALLARLYGDGVGEG